MAATTQAAPSASGEPTKLFGHIRLWLALVGLVTILAGLLFGYDQGIISGALQFIQQDFGLSQLLTEVVTSWVTLGALVGALLAGGLADKLGRRLTLILAGALFLAGALLSGLAPGTAVLVLGRLVIGFGVGVASVAAPLYAAELAPAESRGRFVSSYQLAITIGILVAYIVDDILSSSGNWRLMLGGASVLGVVLMVFVLAMPESPRWLVRARRSDDAARVLDKVRGTAYTPDAMAALEAELAADEDQASWGEVFSHRLRKPLLVGFGLAVFQQITGINAIIYYANEIFGDAGFDTPQEQAAATTWTIGVVNVVATFIAIAFVDRFGRKPLLRAGLVGMALSLTVVGIGFRVLEGETGNAGGADSFGAILTLGGLIVFIASFAFSLGPIVWTVINEIYPSKVRGRAVSVATAVNWGSAWLVSQFFLTLVDAIGQAGTFWLFAGFSAVAFAWVTRAVPETKGRTLEEIEAFWT